jgi:DNA/RNA endonuclease YhcR with UshA esterase domain
MRVIKAAAIALATVGLVALWWAARHVDVPLLTAAETLGTMNMAYVRLQGTVVRSLSYDPESDYLSFWLDDGTGEVMVSAYRDVTRALIAEERLPMLGDNAEVAGTLRIREDFVSLTLNVPEHLALERPEPLPARAGTLTSLDEGLRVVVTGEVRETFIPYEGLTLITVRDASGDVSVVVDETLTALTGPLPEVMEGQGVVVTGTVALYRNEPQLVPASVGDIALKDVPDAAAVAELRRLSSLTAEDAGAWVRVQGRVVALTGFNGGVKATLDDGTDQGLLLIWSSVHDALPDPTALDVGAELDVEGEVQLYEETLEVVPERASDVRLRVAASAPPWVEVGSLAAYDAGRVVRLRGVLGTPTDFSSGTKVPLDDGTGVIPVLLWSNLVSIGYAARSWSDG